MVAVDTNPFLLKRVIRLNAHAPTPSLCIYSFFKWVHMIRVHSMLLYVASRSDIAFLTFSLTLILLLSETHVNIIH